MATENLSVEAVGAAAVSWLLKSRKEMRRAAEERGCVFRDEHDGEYARLAGIPGAYPLSDESIVVGAVEALQIVGMVATAEEIVAIWQRLVDGELAADPAIENWIDGKAAEHYLRAPA